MPQILGTACSHFAPFLQRQGHMGYEECLRLETPRVWDGCQTPCCHSDQDPPSRNAKTPVPSWEALAARTREIRRWCRRHWASNDRMRLPSMCALGSAWSSMQNGGALHASMSVCVDAATGYPRTCGCLSSHLPTRSDGVHAGISTALDMP
ncbi:hypothetical protein GQ53DRAFT_132210 [Thozetella sp. PMI_491]|nr:hypothetical protein GQ53DRAFT_132210 [Thozetella sp. PMI_491]